MKRGVKGEKQDTDDSVGDCSDVMGASSDEKAHGRHALMADMARD